MKYLYKYPQRKFPYDQLVQESAGRSREVVEYELLDSGIFDDNRYWDVFVEVSFYTCCFYFMRHLTDYIALLCHLVRER